MVDGALPVPGRDAAAPLEPVDQPLDAVAPPVGLPVEARAAGLPCRRRITAPRPRRRRKERTGRPVQALPPATRRGRGRGRPRPVGPPGGAPGQQGRKPPALVPLAPGRDEGDRLAAAPGAQVELGREPAARAARGLTPPVAPVRRAPAAGRCARMIVAATERGSQSIRPAASAAVGDAASARSQTPRPRADGGTGSTRCRPGRGAAAGRAGAPPGAAPTRCRSRCAGGPRSAARCAAGRRGGSRGPSRRHRRSLRP